MRISSGRWIVATLLVVLLAGAPARADLISLCEFHWNRTALALAALVYAHVPTVPAEGWAEERWQDMHARTAALRRAQRADPGGDHTLRVLTVREGETLLAREFGPDAAPARQGGTDGPGVFATLTGPTEGGYVLGGDLAMHTRDDLFEAIQHLPEGSLAVATYVARFTNAAFVVTLNLNGVLLRETRIDWETLMKQKHGLQDRLADWKKKRNKESLSALVKTRTRMAVLERLARSAFKIGFGVMLGLALWLLVRRF